MNIEKYEELSGITIPESKIRYYEALIKRTGVILENLLGYTLKPKHIYTELGRTQAECVCPSIPQTSELLPPEEVRGIIKVFPYNHKDHFLHVDPFNDVYNVKLVRVTDDHHFITYKVFESFTEEYLKDGIGLYIEKCQTCFCDCDCKDCIQLAVDADWVDFEDDEGLPIDLLYLWVDMIDYYGDKNRYIKSESVDGHSWSVSESYIPPETTDWAKLLLKRYAGPFGSITRMPTI